MKDRLKLDGASEVEGIEKKEEPSEKLFGLIKLKGSNRFLNKKNIDSFLFASKTIVLTSLGITVGSILGTLLSGVPAENLFTAPLPDVGVGARNVALGTVLGIGAGLYLSFASTFGWKFEKLK